MNSSHVSQNCLLLIETLLAKRTKKKIIIIPPDSAVFFSVRQLQNDFLGSLFWFYGAEPFLSCFALTVLIVVNFKAQQVVRVRGGEGNYEKKKKKSHPHHTLFTSTVEKCERSY